MTDSSQLQITYAPETKLGYLPLNTKMQQIRVTGESLDFGIENIRSQEIRPDRQTQDLIQVGAKVSGGYNFEMSLGTHDALIEAAMFSNFEELLSLKNDGATNNIILSIDSATDKINLSSGGDQFVKGSIIKASNFKSVTNNNIFTVSASSANEITVSETGTLQNENIASENAKLKLVGFKADVDDFKINANGIASTLFDFTILQLQVGQWIKIGGTAVQNQFNDELLNNYARITSISPNQLGLDNYNDFATTDLGSGKEIIIYFGDVLKVGSEKKSFTFEKAFLGQQNPSYISYRGCVLGSMSLEIEPGEILKGSFEFLGLDAKIADTTIDNMPLAASSSDILNSANNIGRVAEAGSDVAGPNFVQSVSFKIDNNLRENTAIGSLGLVNIGTGDSEVTGTINAFFGDKTLYEKFINGVPSSFNFITGKNQQAMILTIAKLKFTSGSLQAAARNQDVINELGFTALFDPITQTQLQFDRFEFVG